jgi:membrane protein implicated in regulation of membrane protease activity
MVNSLQLRVIGTVGLVFGMLILLWGFLMLSKQWLATGIVVIIIAVTLLYYGKRMGEMTRQPTDKQVIPPRQGTPPRR